MSLAKLFIVFAVMITAVYSLPLFNRQFNGQGTFYNVGLGACGQTNSDDEYVAALNVAQWGSPPNPNKAPFCGKKATISGPSGTVTVTIVDLCKSCKNGDMDLSPAAFSKIADLSEGRVQIKWNWNFDSSTGDGNNGNNGDKGNSGNNDNNVIINNNNSNNTIINNVNDVIDSTNIENNTNPPQ